MALITYLTRIQFDFGALGLIGDELAGLGVTRPLIVTDKGLVATGLVERLQDALPNAVQATLFDGTPENPTEAAAEQALAQYRADDCDGVIGFGGGSSMDLGKAVALLATHDGPLAQYAFIEGGVARITAAVAPTIAIPTTAGTGSEVGRGSIMVMNDGRKLGVVSPHMIPSVALCDPELTLGLPPGLTAATGLDALAHCVETYLSPLINPPAEAIGLDGAARVARYLARATQNGGDRAARWQMMMAAMEGAMAFQKGLGAVHALSHPLGGVTDLTLHHGTLNAVLMPAVLYFNTPKVGDKYNTLSAVLGVDDSSALTAWMVTFNQGLGIPSGLAAMGVTADHLPAIAEAAIKDHCHATNPREATVADYMDILEQSMG